MNYAQTKRLFADSALLPDGWSSDVLITIEDGHIASVEPNATFAAGEDRHASVVPGMPNLHSHAFQRAMAGLAERRGRGRDSFWSWRQTMYDFALKITPEQLQAVAELLYVEMLETGFTRVGEFHYLHHDRDGRPYGNIAELAGRISEAALSTGIGLTLLPVFYAHSGFGALPPTDAQRRFISGMDDFAALMDHCRGALPRVPGSVLGVAPHSLRAVSPQDLAALTALAHDGPVHIHIAEQTKEVEDCLAWSGARPVEWLLANAKVDARWCLVHATHMTEDETVRLAASGAVAGLCPVTEANLGDGIFNGSLFLSHGGRFGIGSDSNVMISLPAELSHLEYSQRLAQRERTVLAPEGGSNGRHLFDRAVEGGGTALGRNTAIAVGNSADFVSLDTTKVPYLHHDQVLDSWIFAGGVSVDGVWVRGHKVVENGRHFHRDRAMGGYLAAISALMAH